MIQSLLMIYRFVLVWSNIFFCLMNNSRRFTPIRYVSSVWGMAFPEIIFPAVKPIPEFTEAESDIFLKQWDVKALPFVCIPAFTANLWINSLNHTSEMCLSLVFGNRYARARCQPDQPLQPLQPARSTVATTAADQINHRSRCSEPVWTVWLPLWLNQRFWYLSQRSRQPWPY